MSAIGEIMSAATELGDLRIMAANGRQSPGEIGDATSELRELIAAAIDDARRDGAGQMREAAAALCKAKADREGNKAMETEDDEPDMVDSLKATAWDFMVMESTIRALPLPTGPRVGLPAADYKQGDGSKNCMQCAVAYMLGLPVEAIPDFEREHSPQRTAWERMEEFFESHGHTVEMFPPNVEITGDYLASGTTSRGTSHMIVMRGGKLLHDPHPSNAGLQSIQVVWLIARRAGPSAEFTGPRQAVHLSHAEIAEAFLSRCPAHLRGDHDVRDMQARPDVMEMGRAIETAVLAANGIGERK